MRSQLKNEIGKFVKKMFEVATLLNDYMVSTRTQDWHQAKLWKSTLKQTPWVNIQILNVTGVQLSKSCVRYAKLINKDCKLLFKQRRKSLVNSTSCKLLIFLPGAEPWMVLSVSLSWTMYTLWIRVSSQKLPTLGRPIQTTLW